MHPEYRGVRISEASGLCLVAMAMCIVLAVENYEAAFQSSRTLVRKANQRLVLCVPVLL